jgi:glycosyltransferase involved in cell wall biosynthesis
MQEKIKILFVITQSEMGGAQRFLNTLIPNLDKGKYESILAAGSDGNWDAFNQVDAPKIKLKYAKRNINPIKDLFVIFELRKVIKKHRPDILFLNSSKTSVWGPLAALISNPRPKIIYRIGGWSFNDPRSALSKKFWIFLEKMFAPLKDYIIVNNRYDFEQAKSLGIKPKKEVRLVYNGIDLNKIKFLEKDVARKELGLGSDYLIGTIANFYKTKGLPYLIEAIGDIDNKKLVIIGDGKERKNLENIIRENGLKDKVILLGKKKNASQYLKAFDVFVLPSVKEGFPWSVLEAMTAKVPVIATRVGAVPEIITHKENGLIIEPKEPQQIVKALNEIDNLDLTDNAYQIVSEKFTLNKMTSEIEEVIDM